MDAFNHVNNVAYFRYFETARIASAESLGIMDYLQAEQIGPIIASTSCRYKAPLTYPDTIHIGVMHKDLKNDRFSQQYFIYSEALDRIVTEGEAMIVFYDFKHHQKADIPAQIHAQLALICPPE